MEKERVIYDLGANNGDDLPYFLEKAHKVVAVEALPGRADDIRERFSAEVARGILVVENVAVTDHQGSGGHVDIWVHREDAKSTVIQPEQDKHLFKRERVPAVPVSKLIETHGPPYFIKIDLENYDANILRALFLAEIFPPFISAEGHDPAVFGLLAGLGKYRSFKIIHGRRVERDFRDFSFKNLFGEQRFFSFPWGSAGPFGDDIPGPWIEPASTFSQIRVLGTGWFDIHASFEVGTRVPPSLTLDELLGSDIVDFLEPKLRNRLKKLRRILRAGRRVVLPRA